MVYWTLNVDHQNLSRIMNVPYFIDTRSLFIGNLDSRITKESLDRLFCSYGTIVSIKIICKQRKKKQNTFAFIKYQQAKEAADAVRQENSKKYSSPALRITYQRYSLCQAIRQYPTTNSTLAMNFTEPMVYNQGYCYYPYGYPMYHPCFYPNRF
ncbi:hypothetical protein BY458DRAFT_310412 [Sporodiniella umbellata]|nr:hypothetical protein BY458DRAFT_310412 [Sporodiniella umbellata]